MFYFGAEYTSVHVVYMFQLSQREREREEERGREREGERESERGGGDLGTEVLRLPIMEMR